MVGRKRVLEEGGVVKVFVFLLVFKLRYGGQFRFFVWVQLKVFNRGQKIQEEVVLVLERRVQGLNRDIRVDFSRRGQDFQEYRYTFIVIVVYMFFIFYFRKGEQGSWFISLFLCIYVSGGIGLMNVILVFIRGFQYRFILDLVDFFGLRQYQYFLNVF